MPAAQPRRRISPPLCAKVLASPIPRYVLADRAGFPQNQHLSSLLHDGWAVPSPKTVARLRLVAQLVGFEGEVFLDEEAGA